MSIVLGYDPVTLREKVDLQALGARLEELGALRSIDAMNEKVGLLRLANRLDEALEVANAAVRMARFGGDREALLFARVRRAQVQQYQGRADAALVELSDCVAEASGHDWPEAEAFALQHRGKVYFDLEEHDKALRDFRAAHSIRSSIQASPHQIEASLFALTATEGMLASGRETAGGAGLADGARGLGASAPSAGALDVGALGTGARSAGAPSAGHAAASSARTVDPAAVPASIAATRAEAVGQGAPVEQTAPALPAAPPPAAWAYAQAVSAGAPAAEAVAAATARATTLPPTAATPTTRAANSAAAPIQEALFDIDSGEADG